VVLLKTGAAQAVTETHVYVGLSKYVSMYVGPKCDVCMYVHRSAAVNSGAGYHSSSSDL